MNNNNKIRKTVIASLVISGLTFTNLFASHLVLRVPLSDELSSWKSIEAFYHDWEIKGNHYDCKDWNPDVSDVNYGESYIQYRDCSQDQERAVEIREHDSFSDKIRTIRNEIDKRTLIEKETRSSIGKYQNWSSYESTYTDYENQGNRYNFSEWSPLPGSQLADFTQSRSYSQSRFNYEQKREKDSVTGDIRNIGSAIKHSNIISNNEIRNISVKSSSWKNISTSGFSNWLPVANNQTSSFNQTRNYDQFQKRDWTYTSSGNSIYTREENRTLSSQSESRPVEISYSTWVNNGSVSYSGWSPSASNTCSGSTLSQSRTLTQPQKRYRSYISNSSTISSVTESKNVYSYDSRTVNGTKDCWISADPSYSAWTTYSTSYGGWTPSASSQTSGFSQSRSVTYSQSRTKQPRVYNPSTGELRASGSSSTEYQTVSGPADRRSVSATASSWTNSGAGYGYGSWTPTPGSQTSSFSQSRSYNQNQNRTWTYKTGSTTLGTNTQSQTIVRSESRSVSVSTSSTTTSVTFSPWSPALGGKCSHIEWPVTRTRTEVVSKTRSYAVGSTILTSTNLGSSTTTTTQSVTMYGQKNCGYDKP